jgi:hypothetical protein
VRLVLHPLCEPPHSGMVSKRLHGIIASCKVCIANRDVCTFRWQGPHRATVLPGSRRLSSCLPFLLRFIFLVRERGKRWWRVRRSSPRSLPHSWHLPAALCPEFSSFCVIPRLYGPSTRTPRHLLAPEGAEWWVLERPGTQGRAWSLCESASCSPATSNFGLLPYALTRYQQPEGQR